jgi:hypothetical protein
VSLNEAKTAFNQIVDGRLRAIANAGMTARVPPSVHTMRLSIDGIMNANLLWNVAKDILQTLTAVMPVPDQGCCTYTVDGQNFRTTMTSAECDMTPLPHSFDPTGPCP